LPTHLPASDLILSLGESPGVAQLLPGIVERTGAQAVIAPVDSAAWMPDGLVRQLAAWFADAEVNAVFPRPFCSLTENSYNAREQKASFDDPWIAEFARHFGCPALRIESDGWLITAVDVERDAAVGDAVVQASSFHHHYPCLASTCVDPVLGEPLIQIAGDFMRQAVAGQLEVENR
jgi:hypothetical protein